MKRVTKILAEHLAAKLVAKRKKDLHKQLKSFIAKCERHYGSKVPEEVLEVYEKNPEYFQNLSIIIYLNGSSYRHSHNVINVPADRNKINIYRSDVDNLKSIASTWDKLIEYSSEIKTVEYNLRSHFYNVLRTPKRVLEEFPELKDFFKKGSGINPPSQITKEVKLWLKKD